MQLSEQNISRQIIQGHFFETEYLTFEKKQFLTGFEPRAFDVPGVLFTSRPSQSGLRPTLPWHHVCVILVLICAHSGSFEWLAEQLKTLSHDKCAQKILRKFWLFSGFFFVLISAISSSFTTNHKNLRQFTMNFCSSNFLSGYI